MFTHFPVYSSKSEDFSEENRKKLGAEIKVSALKSETTQGTNCW